MTLPFASEQLRRRLWRGTQQVDAFVAAVEREGQRESDRIARVGVAVAQAAGWSAEAPDGALSDLGNWRITSSSTVGSSPGL
jgi:hypothetical protein